MQVLFCILLLALAAFEAQAASTSCNCGWVNSGRIIGGHEAPKNKYPMMVAVETRGGQQFCGGTILTPWHVISAAHCTYGEKPSNVNVRVGAHNKKSSGVAYEVARIINHENYNNKIIVNDISLLVTAAQMTFHKNVGPACLPNQRVSITGQKVTALGWGVTSSKGGDSDVLLEVQLDVKSFAECSQRWSESSGPTPYESMHLCTYTSRKDTCQQDSGGPLIWLDPETKRYSLVALVSYGGECGGPLPGVNTDVSAYLDWIKAKIAASKPGVEACRKL